MGAKDPGEAATSRGVTNLDVSEIDMAQDSRPCKGCGEPIYRTVPVAPIKHYHGPECRPRCSVGECEKPVHAKDMCSAHSTRAERYGDPLAPKVRERNEGECSVEGCDRPMRKTRLCAGHYSMLAHYGEIREWAYRWSDEPTCLLCGKPNGSFKSRKYCSAACQQFVSRWRGRLPSNPSCARCGVEIDLATAGKNGRRKKADTKLCGRCRSQTRTEATPGELALRDGPYCQLCGCDVDMLAVAPDPMRPSVDHIIPRAWGGSDAADNNQLTHLICNQIKSDRYLDLSWRSMP